MQNLYLVRHGQSQANVDEEIYKSIPDHRIALTDKGQTQAAFAGKRPDHPRRSGRASRCRCPAARARWRNCRANRPDARRA